jgi:glucose/mannose-6-phosphate isomerase
MNLNDISSFSTIDSQNMRSHIDGLVDQLQAAWGLGHEHALPDWDGIDQVLVAGMGSSATCADLLAAYVAPFCRVPVIVHRDYDLPAWANGSRSLVIACSYSGNTEETLSSYAGAVENGCRRLVLTTGGQLARHAQGNRDPLWIYPHAGQPGAAPGYPYGLLLAAFQRLMLVPDQSQELATASAAMRLQAQSLLAEVPVARNPAKRMAGQLFGRWVMVMGAGLLAPVARRWKDQVNALAKAWAQFDYIPEADHNTVAGIAYPEDLLSHMMALFLRCESDQPRNRLRLDLTSQLFMMEGVNTDFYDAQGDKPLAQQWTALQFGDYLAYYLAMAYGADPGSTFVIDELKKELGSQ